MISECFPQTSICRAEAFTAEQRAFLVYLMVCSAPVSQTLHCRLQHRVARDCCCCVMCWLGSFFNGDGCSFPKLKGEREMLYGNFVFPAYLHNYNSKNRVQCYLDFWTAWHNTSAFFLRSLMK